MGAGLLLAIASLGLALASGFAWYRMLQAVALEGRRGLVMATMGAAAALGAAALVVGPGWLGGIAALLGIVIGGGFLALQSISGQAKRVPAVSVGGPILDFSAPDEHGQPFSLASLSGRPFLLKFFRGHW